MDRIITCIAGIARRLPDVDLPVLGRSVDFAWQESLHNALSAKSEAARKAAAREAA